jgi:predicted aspartyl protease
MIRFKYHPFSSLLGKILRPMAEVILETDGRKVEAFMCVDSGADITMLPLRFGKALGFKQNPKDEILEIKGVSGSGVAYILKKVNIFLNGKKLSVRIAWALIEEVPLLLGRMDIFPKFKITFNEQAETIVFDGM